MPIALLGGVVHAVIGTTSELYHTAVLAAKRLYALVVVDENLFYKEVQLLDYNCLFL
jgi:hypothetical protein